MADQSLRNIELRFSGTDRDGEIDRNLLVNNSMLWGGRAIA
jgi:hypothetical protein